MSETSRIKILGYLVPDYLLVAASTWLSRLLTTAISLVSIRILLDTLGVEHYAAYAVLMGIIGWFMLADFGVSQSLQNYISESRVAQQGYAEYVLAAVVIMFVVIVLGIVAVVVLGEWPATRLLSQFEFLTEKDKYFSFAAVAALAMLTAGGTLVYRIWYAEHKGYLANMATALGAVAALGGIYYVAQSDVTNKLLWCLVAANAPVAVIPVSALLMRVRLTVRAGGWSIKESAKKILKRGGHFWLFNVVAAAVLQMDYIVLSQFVPAEQIVVYSIGTKLFAVAGFMYGAVLQAFWPVCAEATLQGDWERIKSFTKKYLLWGGVFVVMFTVCILMFSDAIASVFSSRGLVAIPAELVVSLGVLYLIRAWTDVFAVILQSMNDMKTLLAWAAVQAVIGLGLQILLVPRYGIYGTVLALGLSWLLTVSWMLPRRVWSYQRAAIMGGV